MPSVESRARRNLCGWLCGNVCVILSMEACDTPLPADKEDSIMAMFIACSGGSGGDCTRGYHGAFPPGFKAHTTPMVGSPCRQRHRDCQVRRRIPAIPCLLGEQQRPCVCLRGGGIPSERMGIPVRRPGSGGRVGTCVV